MRKKAIVTGGAGFIGSHLVERLLEHDCEVVVLDDFSTGRPANLKEAEKDSRLALFRADVSDLNSIRKHFKDVDWVFHLAALADIVPSILEPLKYHRSNVDGTVAVLEASRLNKVKKFIYAASSSCYGIPDKYPTSEDSKIDPRYPYAVTKYIGERYAFFWSKIYKIPVISLRLFNVYGPRSRTSGTYGAVLGIFLAQKLAGMPFTVVGDGTQKRDFIYVSDVAEAFIKAAASDVKNEIFNVGSGNPQSINKLVSILGGEKVCIAKRPGEPDCTWADITKINDIIKWQPLISFEEGLNMVLKNIDYWKDAPVWTPEKIGEVTKEWFTYLS